MGLIGGQRKWEVWEVQYSVGHHERVSHKNREDILSNNIPGRENRKYRRNPKVGEFMV